MTVAPGFRLMQDKLYTISFKGYQINIITFLASVFGVIFSSRSKELICTGGIIRRIRGNSVFRFEVLYAVISGLEGNVTI